MHRLLGYTFFFVVLVLLQAFLFNNLNMSVYVNPLVYIAFILLLPMELPTIITLLLGLLLGVATDFTTGNAGLNTIATLATAFSRRQILILMMGKEAVGEGGIPSSGRIGTGRFLRYAGVIAVVHSLIFFSFEAMNFSHFHVTLVKVVLSAAVTVTLIFFAQFLLPGTYGGKTADKA